MVNQVPGPNDNYVDLLNSGQLSIDNTLAGAALKQVGVSSSPAGGFSSDPPGRTADSGSSGLTNTTDTAAHGPIDFSITTPQTTDSTTGFPSVPDQRATPSDVVGNIDPYGMGLGVDPWSSTGYSSGGAAITNPLTALTGSNSGSWWNIALKDMQDLFTRGGLALLALVLIGVGVWWVSKDEIVKGVIGR